MKRRNGLMVLLCAVLILSLFAGCGTAAPTSSAAAGSASPAAESAAESAAPAPEEAAAEEEVTLTVWGDTDNQAILEPFFTDLNAKFMEKNPNIIIDYQWSGSFDGINVAMQSDTLPDLFWVQGNKSTAMSEMAEAGMIIPLDKYNPDSSMYPEDAIGYAQVDGQIYCSFPAFVGYTLVYFNEDIFAEHNLTKPATYDEFMAAVEALSAAGVTPIALGGDFEWSRYWPLQSMCASLASGDLKKIEGGQTTGDFPEIISTFNLFRDMCEKGYFGDPPGALDESSAQLAFSNANAAMIFEGTWNNPMFSELAFDVGRFAFPDNNGVRYAQSGYSNFTTYAISSRCENPDQAFKYVEYLNTLEAQQLCADYTKETPVLSEIKLDNPDLAEIADFQDVGKNINHVLSNVPTESGKPAEVFLSGVIADLMTGTITGEEGMQMLIDEMGK